MTTAIDKAKPRLKRNSPPRMRADFMRRAVLEALECRFLLSAAHDVVGITALRNDPVFAGIDGSGITIAFFDAGVYADNPDLIHNFIGEVNAVSPADPNNLVLDTNPAHADSEVLAAGEGHGTHTAGIAASTNPEYGAAIGAKFIEIRNIPFQGESQTVSDPFHPGMEWILQNAQTYNIKVVNISEGDPSNSDDPALAAQQNAQRASDIQALENAGIAVVVSSGNNYAEYADGTLNDELGNALPAVLSDIAVGNTIAGTIDPASLNQAYGIGPDFGAVSTALGSTDQIEATSQRDNLANQLFAPGDNITSTWPGPLGGNAKSDSGTSMSAPLVAGIIALMQNEAHSLSGTYLTVNQIANILQSTADTITDNSISSNLLYSISQGATVGTLPTTSLTYKRVNAYAALQAVKALFALPEGKQFLPIGAAIQQLPDLNGTEAFDAINSIAQPNAVDLYKVNVDETANFQIYLTLPPNGGQAFDATLRIFDSTGTQIGIAGGLNSGTLTLSTSPQAPLPAGTYYIGVSSEGNNNYDPVAGTGAAGGQTTGDFRLNVNVVNNDPNGVVSGAVAVDLAVPNEYTTRTTPFDNDLHYQGFNFFQGVLGSDDAVSGSVNTSPVNVDDGDVDMYKVQAPDDGFLYITSDDIGPSASQSPNTYLRVFKDNGDGTFTEVANTAGENASATTSSLTVLTQIGATYYVAVSDFSNESYDPQNSAGRPTNSTPHTDPLIYGLSILFDNGDSNGTAFTAVTKAVGSTIVGAVGADNNTSLYDTNPATATFQSLNFTKDVDWLAFPIAQTGVFDLAVASSSGFTPDLAFWLYDSNSQQVVKIADSAGSGELSYPAQAGQTIYTTISDVHNSGFNWNSVASGSGGAAGTFTLSSSFLSSSAIVSLNNDSILNGTPTPLSLGQTTAGNIGIDGSLIRGQTDVDLYTFQAPSTGLVTLSTLTQNESDADTVVRAFDANGVPLATSQSFAFNEPGGQITIPVTAGQTYYIGVSGVAGSISNYSALNGSNAPAGSTGSYRLAVSDVLPAPAQLAITGQPLGAIKASTIGQSISVMLQDANGNLVPTDDSVAHLAILHGPDGGRLRGIINVQAQNGVATFDDFSFSRPGKYQLVVTDANLPHATLANISVTLPPAKLVFTQPPATTIAGHTIALTVKVEDAAGRLVTTDSSNVTLALSGIHTGATLAGTLTAQAIGGIATFNGLTLTKTGTFTFKAADPHLTPAFSRTFTITPDLSTSQLSLSRIPIATAAGKPLAPALTVSAIDQFGNRITSNHSKILLATTTGTFTGPHTLALTSGIGTFTNLRFPTPGTYTLTASPATNSTFAITTPLSFSQTIT